LVDLFDFHIGADLFPELLQNLTDIASARRRGDDHLEIDRLAVILDQRLGLLNIVRQRAVVLALDPGAIAVGVTGRPGQAIGKGLRHLLAIDRHHQCLAHAHIVERGNLGVEGSDLGAGPGIGMDRHLRIFLGSLNIVRIVLIIPDNIRFTGLQGGEARLRVRQRLQNNPVKVRMTLVPVVRIAFENHSVARGP
jgi:hypothetical protein